MIVIYTWQHLQTGSMVGFSPFWKKMEQGWGRADAHPAESFQIRIAKNTRARESRYKSETRGGAATSRETTSAVNARKLSSVLAASS